MNKLNKYLVYIFLSVAPYFCFAQDYWEIIDVPDTIQIKSMATNNQNHIFLGTGGNNMFGGIYRSVDNCNTWEFLGFENHGIGFIELNTANHLFISFSGCIYKSINNGVFWDTLFCYDGFVGISCFKSYEDNLMFAGLDGNITGIIRSIDNGENWEEVFIVPPYSEFFSDIAIQNEDNIYVCTTNWFDGGGVYRSTDGGDNWEHIGMYNFHCFSLAKNSSGDIFVGTYGHNTQYWLSGVYVLYNGEDEWVQLYSTLVNDMAVNSNDHLYVATDYGVLKSTDNGQSFEYINEGLFTGDVDDLAIDSSGFLYASSYNPCNMARSLEPTIIGINTLSKNNITISINNYPNPVSGFTTFIINTKPGNYREVVIKIYNTQGQLIDEIKTGITLTGVTTINYNAGNLPAGVYYYHTIINEQKLSGRFIKY